MKLSILPVLVIFSLTAFAQSEKIPQVLQPDPKFEAVAARMDAQIFRLLPSQSLYRNSKYESHDDRDYPLGIRGSGAFYSFSNRSHSFNKWPEISLQSPRLVSGPTTTLTLVRDLGTIDISLIANDTPELGEIRNYKYPSLLREIGSERTRLYEKARDGFLNLTYRVGNSYLFRAITLERSDIIVAFTILSADADGGLTIAWRELHKFPVPVALYLPDDELQRKVNSIVAEEHIICDSAVIRDNHLYFVKDRADYSFHDGNVKLEQSLARRKVRLRGIGGSLPK